MKHYRKLIVLCLLALTTALLAAGSAWAYYTWKATSASASATLAQRSTCTSQAADPSDGECTLYISTALPSNLGPGQSGTFSFYVKQGPNSAQRIFSLANLSSSISTSDPGCLPAWFSVSSPTWTSAFGTPAASFTGQVATLGATSSGSNGVNGDATLSFSAPAVNQDACSGKTVTVALTFN